MIQFKPGAVARALASLALSTLAWSSSLNPDVKKLAARVDAHYNALATMAVDFTETYVGLGVKRNESGKLALKRPGKMRWDYTSPLPKLFISDGETAYFYVPGEHQARRASVKQLDDLRSPLRYLLGKTRLEKEFSDLKITSDVAPLSPGDTILSGIPKQMADRVNRVLLEITATSQIRRIVIQEVDGSSTEFQFQNFQENRPLADSQFRLSIPAGVEVIEAKELSGQ